MPLQVSKEAIFCLDFARGKFDYVPYEATIPGLVYRKIGTERTVFGFDSENISMTFGQVQSEMEKFAAGILNAGMKIDQRILICGNNHSQLVIAALGTARAGLVFSIASPNFQNSNQISHLLKIGEFNAFIYFGPSDHANQLLLEICPELKKCPKGKLKSKAFPNLSHVIFADEDHKHSGTYTLSDIFIKANAEEIAKLPKYEEWNCHKLGAIQFTLGSTGPAKAVGLTHYQLINGCRIAANAIGIKREVSADLLISIEALMPKAKNIAVGMISTELGCIPILSDNTTNLVKSIGKVLSGYEVDVIKVDKLNTNNGHRIGELRLRPLAKTKFIGYAPKFETDSQEWVNTGDVVCIQQDGNVEIITQHTQDLVFDKIGRLVEHWRLERILAQMAQQIRGVQIVQISPGAPVVAVVVPKKENSLSIADLKKEMVEICRENRMDPPEQLAVLPEFPRVNTKIQKYKIREELRAQRLKIY